MNSKCNACEEELFKLVESKAQADAVPIRIAEELNSCVQHEMVIANTLNFQLLRLYTHENFLHRVSGLIKSF
jgi:hypothetical protein